jgi:hypothetical protein
MGTAAPFIKEDSWKVRKRARLAISSCLAARERTPYNLPPVPAECQGQVGCDMELVGLLISAQPTELPARLTGGCRLDSLSRWCEQPRVESIFWRESEKSVSPGVHIPRESTAKVGFSVPGRHVACHRLRKSRPVGRQARRNSFRFGRCPPFFPSAECHLPVLPEADGGS